MHALQVGQRYHPDAPSWPEGSEFNWEAGGASLVLRFDSPTSREAEATRRGSAEFALAVTGDVIWLLYQFSGGVIPWSDCSYSWHLLPAERRGIPPAQDTGETRLLLSVILLDARDGIIRSLRTLTLDPEFTRALLGSIRVQASTPWCGQADYDRQIAAAYARWPSTEAMLRDCQIRCQGGI